MPAAGAAAAVQHRRGVVCGGVVRRGCELSGRPSGKPFQAVVNIIDRLTNKSNIQYSTVQYGIVQYTLV